MKTDRDVRGTVAPAGFTLVELLVVIGILGLLAALLTPAVMRALASARNAAIKSEIDMLHMALMNYKSEYGVAPPCGVGGIAASVRHLKRLFPRCADPADQLKNSGMGSVSGTSAISKWLAGFRSDPQYPLCDPQDLLTASQRVGLFDFDRARLNSATGAYAPKGKPGSPYVYIDASSYAAMPYAGGGVPGAMMMTLAGDTSPFVNVPGEANQFVSNEFFNSDTFQILCAGADETFGTDDDLSNFWPGTRKDYLDSLKKQ